MVIYYFLATAICFIFLFKSADILVKSSSSIASHYGISPVFIGLVLVGVGTSAPEIFVTTIASFLRHPEVVLGNATGSIACNTGLAMAVIFWLISNNSTGFTGEKRGLGGKFCLVNALFLAGGAFAMIFLFKNGITRLQGVALLMVLVFYLYVNSKISKDYTSAPKPENKIWTLFLKFSVTLVIILVLSRIIIWSATGFARIIGVSEFIIGITLIAFGTSLTEIATSISALKQGELGIAVGELVGSQALNLYLLLGLSSIIRPIEVSNSKFIFGWMFLILAELFLFIWLEKIPPKVKAGILFATYCVYIISNFNIL